MAEPKSIETPSGTSVTDRRSDLQIDPPITGSLILMQDVSIPYLETTSLELGTWNLDTRKNVFLPAAQHEVT